MTGRQAANLTLATLSETAADNGEFLGFAVGMLNVLLQETLEINNTLCQVKGKTPLAEAPMLESLDQEIPYEAEILRSVIPYGLAEKYVYDEGDPTKINYYNSLYVNAVNACTRGLAQENGVEDLY